MIEEAWQGLYPDKDFPYVATLEYSGRFKPYNANVKYTKNRITFNLSKTWKRISKDIQIGLMQSLFLKIFKDKKKTTNIDLYNNFMRNVHISIPKTKTHPVLEASFDRVNEKFFDGMVERPNLVMMKRAIRRLGSYEYGSDTIKISEVLLEDYDALDYVMYHEVLHKVHKFRDTGIRSIHHTRKFRLDEQKYPGADIIEKRLGRLVSKQKLRSLFF